MGMLPPFVNYDTFTSLKDIRNENQIIYEENLKEFSFRTRKELDSSIFYIKTGFIIVILAINLTIFLYIKGYL